MKKRKKGGEKTIAKGKEGKTGKSKDYCIREREKDDGREAAR